jgi:hypothetical protein
MGKWYHQPKLVDSVEQAKWNGLVDARKKAQKALQADNKAMGVRRYQEGGVILSKGR